MCKKLSAIIIIILSLFIVSPCIYANQYPENEYNISSWDSLSRSQKYYAYYQAVKKVEYDGRSVSNIPSYDVYNQSPDMQYKVDQVGRKYIHWNDNDGFFVPGTRQGDYDSTINEMFVNSVEENGIGNFGTGNFNGPANSANQTATDNFYNNSSSDTSPEDGTYNSDPLVLKSNIFDLGNGYTLQGVTTLSVKWDTNTAWWQNRFSVVEVYFNGTFRTTIDLGGHTTRFKEYYLYPVYYMSTQTIDNSTHYFINCHFNNDIEGDKTLTADITQYVTFQNPNGNSIPEMKTIKLWSPPYTPQDGNDQSAVNEELQTQNNDIISWLEKIYNMEISINSSINALLNPLYSLSSTISNLYDVCTAILNKLDNLTVKLKDWQGNEFKIDLGDLELGDITVDFDVVYNITGINKITAPNDVFKDMYTHKSAIESKLGISNLKQTVNNFTTSIFGQVVFNPNGNVVTGTISETSATPHLYFTFMGTQYDLFSALSDVDSNIISTWKDIVTFFLYASTVLCVIKSLPVLIGGVAGIENRATIVEHVQMEDNFVNTYLKMSGGQFPVTGQMYDAGYKGRWI